MRISRLIWIALLGAYTSLASGQERIPIDLGPNDSEVSKRTSIDIIAPPPNVDEETSSLRHGCDDPGEDGLLEGTILVCRDLEIDSDQYFSGSRAAWLTGYAERSQGHNTIPTPDVAGSGIFRGQGIITGLCFVPPCPRPPMIIVDVESNEMPPLGSDADRLSRGLPPTGKEYDSDSEVRRRLEAELGLPQPQSEASVDR